MKKTILLLLGLLLACGVNAQQAKTIKLNAPRKEGGKTIMQALSERKSTREFSPREISLQDLSDLLWAANGFNRPEKRTAATASNQQEIDLYVCRGDGAWLYNAKANQLELVTDQDVRTDLAGRQAFSATAPVTLLIVADLSRMKSQGAGAIRTSAYDAGIVSQNIYLYASGCGMATVCRASMEKDAVKQKMGFGENHYLHLNHPIGYPKE